MNVERDVGDLARQTASDLRMSIGLLVRRLRRTKDDDGTLSLPEALALSRLERDGPSTGADLARSESITPQAMATTLRALESAGLIERATDPTDGRRVRLSATELGRTTMQTRRSTGNAALAARLEADFTAAEIEQLGAAASLIERLARSL